MTGIEHKDARGLFVELLKQKDLWKYKQMSLLTIEPNFFRGRHYHKITKEAFMLLEGDCDLTIYYGKEVEDSPYFQHPTVIAMDKYELYEVVPEQQHVLMSKKGAKLLVFSEHEFDPTKPDVYIYE